MNKFGMYVKFTTHEGQRDAFAQILLEAAAGMQSTEACELYIVNVSDSEPETVWVTEIWSDSAAHEASLAMEETKEMIQRARPLIASVEQIKLRPLGGKGV
ncbi:antibiotic biosynthesis monooxygenase [Paenibacillus sp. WST5]|uniref:Antibiotic biosynthesis monooxygenase n=2 Tax=Paenibacillus sedimenti TaxID=2770274 RepID=A0A926KP16_9BACL|nr:antibiotic biosynthesis monooxygenase [Paenibacillus sedimenti]